MHPFEEYLKAHNLEALAVSIKAQVRYVTVWNAVKGNPITSDHAQKIRRAIIVLTGVPYTGSFTLLQEQPQDRTLVKRFPRPTH